MRRLCLPRHLFGCLLICLLGGLGMTKPVGANDLAHALRDGHAAGNLPGLHSVYVSRYGMPLAEVYFEGADQVWGTDIGNRQHGPDTLHDLRSMTKSIVSLLYGIALNEGFVPPVDALLLAQFPDYADLYTPERDSITIEDVLTMRMGMAWDETLPYTDPDNAEIAMEAAADRIRFVLSQPMQDTPGTVFTYSGGAATLLAELIARGAGEPVDVFARTRLFEPLGIKRAEWVHGADGRPSAASGLRLSARAMARIGEMVLNNGVAGDVQVVPASWIAASMLPRVETAQLRYGYQWWLSPKDAPEWAAALGNGGQRLSVVKSMGLVAVIHAGNYNQPDDWEIPVAVMTQFILPALVQ